MTKRIHNVTKWAKLGVGQVLELDGDAGRLVRLELNTSERTIVMLEDGEKLTFLATVDGLEAIEFNSPRPRVHIVCDSEGEVWYFTNDGRKIAGEHPDAVSFTNVMTREKRNPQQDLMIWNMQQNVLRRERQLQVEIERRQAVEAELEAQRAAAEEAASTAAAAAAAEEAAAAAAAKAAAAAAKVPPSA